MTTLDTRVKRRLAEFDEMTATLPGLETKYKEMQTALESEDRDAAPKPYFAIQDAMRELTVQIAKARAADDEKMDYLLKTVPFIKKYEMGDDVTTPLASSPRPGKNDIGSFVTVTGVSNKRSIFTEYMRDVEGMCEEPNCYSMARAEECEACDGRIVFDTETSALICVGCGITSQHIEISTRNLSYDDEINQNQRTAFSYKRLNHLTEYLNSIQAKENTFVPAEVVDAVKNEFRKNRMTSKREITAERVREFLKKLGLSKFYEHTHHIANLINGVPAKRIPDELEAKLKKMFIDIQPPFERHCPAERKNFLSYSYVLYQFCRLLDADDYLDMFTLLKSKEKLYNQDLIWRKICDDLQWQFLATV